MLVLNRKRNQRIIIGDDIELIVVSISRDRVKLGFNAPPGVPIHREEVLRRIELDHATESDEDLFATCIDAVKIKSPAF